MVMSGKPMVTGEKPMLNGVKNLVVKNGNGWKTFKIMSEIIYLLKINSPCHNQHNGDGKNIKRYFCHFCHVLPLLKTGWNFYHLILVVFKWLKG